MIDLKEFGYTDEAINKFNIYYNELISYNEKVNLTAITDREEVVVKHFIDSCLSKEFITDNASVLDIGTGAGFPGVPLKIVKNDIKLTLVDSLNKRIEFLKQLSNSLDLKYDCIHSRAEEFAHSKYRENFDIVVARAVAQLATLCEYTLPLVKVGGIFIAYKGANYSDELNNSKKCIEKLGGKILNIKEYDLPLNFGKRFLIIIKKIKNTEKIYPRGKNLPKLKPII